MSSKRKHRKFQTLLWFGGTAQRVCRVCDNVTMHYQVHAQRNGKARKQWVCTRIFTPMLRKGDVI